MFARGKLPLNKTSAPLPTSHYKRMFPQVGRAMVLNHISVQFKLTHQRRKYFLLMTLTNQRRKYLLLLIKFTNWRRKYLLLMKMKLLLVWGKLPLTKTLAPLLTSCYERMSHQIGGAIVLNHLSIQTELATQRKYLLLVILKLENKGGSTSSFL